jgi:hypothetical protein
MNQGRTMEGAARQLLDDLALARQTAIATRSTVVMVFLPPEIVSLDPFASPKYDGEERTNIMQLQAGAMTSYAMLSCREAGAQPGVTSLRYITPWRHLPEKVFVAESMFTNSPPEGFEIARFPFPFSRSARTGTGFDLPYVAFTAEGKCLPLLQQTFFPNGITDSRNPRDVSVRLASGSIMYTKDAKGALASWTVQEIPPNNSVNSSNVIHIDWLTGRAKIERADVVKP